jgi:hypothetical protein
VHSPFTSPSPSHNLSKFLLFARSPLAISKGFNGKAELSPESTMLQEKNSKGTKDAYLQSSHPAARLIRLFGMTSTCAAISDCRTSLAADRLPPQYLRPSNPIKSRILGLPLRTDRKCLHRAFEVRERLWSACRVLMLGPAFMEANSFACADSRKSQALYYTQDDDT